MATRAYGSARNTEVASGSAAALVYNQAPGVLRFPCTVGDLYLAYNNTVNTLLRPAPTNWLSVRLNFTFAPALNYYQGHLTLYQNDDNYLQAGMVFNSYDGGSVATEDFRSMPRPPLITSRWRRPGTLPSVSTVIRSAMQSRLSIPWDGINWTTISTVNQALVNPRFAIWTGEGPAAAPFPPMDVSRMDVILTNIGSVGLSYSLLNAPTNASISANGVITWTPTKHKGPGRTRLRRWSPTTARLLSATNSFIVVVNEMNVPPVLPTQSTVTWPVGNRWW